MAVHDLVLRDVRIFDGEGNAPVEGDVAISSGRFAMVGDAGSGTVEIDGRGRAVAPGFVDVHTHDDGALLTHPGLEFKVAQGCTSVVVGNCGFSATPPLDQALLGLVSPPWTDLNGYLALVDGSAVNVMSQVGHNTARQHVMGNEQRRPTRNELNRMTFFVESAMQQGACGFTTGLVYEPGRYSATDEIIELAKPCGERGGIYNSHMRNEGDQLLQSVDELIRIGDEAGCGCHISHHKAGGQRNWGRVTDSLNQVDHANAGGADITLDVYPYTAGSGPTYQYFDLDDVDLELAACIRIAASSDFPEFSGRRLIDISDETGEPLEDLLVRIITAPGRERTIGIQFTMSEVDVESNLRHPLVMIGSDGIPDLRGAPHPRLFGTFPRVLGHYVRERGVLDLGEAIRKMTSLASDRFGLVGRGRIVVGGHADLVMFDPATVIDTATYDDPMTAPIGIDLVVVNGEIAFRDGVHTYVRSGRALRYRSADRTR